MTKNIIISWHIPSYGIGFFKNVLSCFYTKQVLPDQNTYVEGMPQSELENGFYSKDGFLFDKAYYFYFSDETCNKLSDRRKSDYISGRAKIELLNDDVINNARTLNIWEDVFQKKFATVSEELSYVEITYPEKYEIFLSQYWRNIHYYPVEEQINWFKKYSNAKEKYDPKRIEFVDFTKEYEILELRDENGLTNAISKFMKDKFNNKNHDSIFVNSGLGTVEMQLAWRNILHDNVISEQITFFSIVDQKENTPINYRFRDLKFIPKELPNPSKKIFKHQKYESDKKNFLFKTFNNTVSKIEFNKISFITTCFLDKSKNDKYLQTTDEQYYRLTHIGFEELMNILPEKSFQRISKNTIISKENENIRSCGGKYDLVILFARYIKNDGNFIGDDAKDIKDYEMKFVGKPIKFIITDSYSAAFKKWYEIDE